MTKVKKTVGAVLLLVGIVMLIGVLGGDDIAMEMGTAVSVKILLGRITASVVSIAIGWGLIR